jgi:hypothetical protein
MRGRGAAEGGPPGAARDGSDVALFGFATGMFIFLLTYLMARYINK